MLSSVTRRIPARTVVSTVANRQHPEYLLRRKVVEDKKINEQETEKERELRTSRCAKASRAFSEACNEYDLIRQDQPQYTAFHFFFAPAANAITKT